MLCQHVNGNERIDLTTTYIFLPDSATGCKRFEIKGKEHKMITTSKNNSFVCVEDIGVDQAVSCQERIDPVEPQVSSIKTFLRDLWSNIRLFAGTDKWGRDVTLRMGDSHYTMRMDEIESRWRNQ